MLRESLVNSFNSFTITFLITDNAFRIRFIVSCFIVGIIAEQTNAEGIKEYYVKWESLPYSDATWESADLIKKRNPEAIKDFKRREASNRTPTSSSKFLRTRPKFSQIKSQPDYLSGETLVHF